MLAIAALLFEWCGPLIVDDVDAFGLNLPIGRYIHIHITPTVDLDDSCNFFNVDSNCLHRPSKGVGLPNYAKMMSTVQ